MIKLEICEKIIDSKVVSIKKIGINEDKIVRVVLSNNGKQFTLFYSVLDKEIKDEKEKYITTNLLNSTVEDKEKFSKHFKKNKENFYLTLLKTKIKMPSNYNKFNICDFIKKEFKENLETANNFLEFDCFYTMGDNYTYFVTEK